MFIENFTWLVLCIYFEARGEGMKAKVLVAHSVVNRSIQRKKTLKETVRQKKQYSWYNGGAIPTIKEPEVLYQSVQAAVTCYCQRAIGFRGRGVNHYYDDSLTTPPYWAASMKALGKVGSFYFFKS